MFRLLIPPTDFINYHGTIQNVLTFDETSFDFVTHRSDNSFEMSRQGLGNDLVQETYETNGEVIIKRERVFDFRNECDKRGAASPHNTSTGFKIF